MQNRYVADIGDFGKFQLFRFLFNTPSPLAQYTLAQIWFLHTDEESNNDGKYINYFDKVLGCDPVLEAIMIDIIQRDKREVFELEREHILENAQFFYPDIPSAYHDRSLWLKKALSFADSCSIVAVAPDNGIALKCHKKEKSFSFLEYHDKRLAPHKYIFKKEIDAFYDAPHRKITIIYQHLGRCFSHQKQTTVLLHQLRIHYSHVIAIKHKPYSPRLFFFLCKDKEILQILEHRLENFVQLQHTFWELYR